MRKIFLFLLVSMLPLVAYSQEAPLHRVVYLWDVTYSMHGGFLGNNVKDVQVAQKPMHIVKYDVDYDIYDNILDALVQSMDKWGDEDEIIIVPFNCEVLVKNIEDWRRRGTESGKKYLEKKIRDFYNDDQTYTNICDPFVYSNSLFDGSKFPRATEFSELYILTDGVHNVKNPSKKTFFNLLNTWCDFAEKYNVHGYYFLLTDQAIKDSELKEVIKNHPCMEFVHEYRQHKFTMEGNRLISVAEGEYDRPIQLSVKPEDVSKPISGSEQIRVFVEPNDYFTLDQKVTVEGSTTSVEVTPNYKMSLHELKTVLPTDSNYCVRVYFEQIKKPTASADGIENKLQSTSCTWQFVNKAQKTLTIKIKRD